MVPSTDPTRPGPYAVGMRTTTIDDATRDGRRLVTQVWYPVTPGAIAPDALPAEYDFLPSVRPPARLAREGAPPPAPGEHPVVVYSHGTGGVRFVASWCTELLASHGFVVIAPDHAGDTSLDAFLGTGVDEATNLLLRPPDVSAVLDALLGGSAEHAWLAGCLDRGPVGVVGHSFGGTTALALAGGLPSWPADPRVGVVVGMATYSRPLSDETLRAVDVPTLLVSGTADVSTPIALDTERPWALIPGQPLLRVDLAGAAHQSFTDVCAYRDLLDTVPDLPEALRDAVHAYAADGCGPGILDIETAFRLTSRYAVAFLQRWLLGDHGAEEWLTEPDAPDDAGIVSLRARPVDAS